MITHPVSVGKENHSIPVKHKMRVHTEIAGVRYICHFTGLHINQCNIAIWVAHLRNKLNCHHAAVGTPYSREAVILSGVAFAVGQLPDISRSDVHNHQLIAVLNKCQFLTIGRYHRMGILVNSIRNFFRVRNSEHHLFRHSRRIRKIGVFLPGDFSTVDIFMAVTL